MILPSNRNTCRKLLFKIQELGFSESSEILKIELEMVSSSLDLLVPPIQKKKCNMATSSMKHPNNNPQGYFSRNLILFYVFILFAFESLWTCRFSTNRRMRTGVCRQFWTLDELRIKLKATIHYSNRWQGQIECRVE